MRSSRCTRKPDSKLVAPILTAGRMVSAFQSGIPDSARQFRATAFAGNEAAFIAARNYIHATRTSVLSRAVYLSRPPASPRPQRVFTRRTSSSSASEPKATTELATTTRRRVRARLAAAPLFTIASLFFCRREFAPFIYRTTYFFSFFVFF